jgi:hypothetical protein
MMEIEERRMTSQNGTIETARSKTAIMDQANSPPPGPYHVGSRSTALPRQRQNSGTRDVTLRNLANHTRLA